MANVQQFIIEISSKGDSAVVGRIRDLQGRMESADRAAMSLSSSVGGNLKSAFMSLPGAQFFTNPIVAMSAGIGAVTKIGMQAESTATSFGVLVGDEKKAADMLGEINRYADETIWDRMGTQNAAKTMLGFGVATDDVVGNLKMLGDMAMGDKNKLQQLALVFGQVSSAGRLQGQDLLQLINAGYNPLIDMSAMTGKSVAELKEKMSKGLISFDMVRQAMQRATSEGGRFAGMTEKLAMTSSGAFVQMKGSALRDMLALYEGMQPLLVPLFSAISDGLTKLGVAIQWAVKGLTWVFSLFKDGNPIVYGIVAAVGAYTAAVIVNTSVLKGLRIAELAQFYALLLVEKGQKLVNLAMSLNPVGLVIAGVAALIAVVVTCWNKFAGFRAVMLTVWDTMKGFAGIIKDLVISRITSLLQGIGKVGEAMSLLFSGKFSQAWDTAKSAGSLMLNIEGKKNAIADMKNLGSSISGNFAGHLAEEREKQKEKAKNKISDPEAAGGVSPDGSKNLVGGAGGGTTDSKSFANDITTGGTRNTQITINIGSMFGKLSNDKGISIDDIQSKVVEAMNRCLEIGYSAAR
ncbi:MAG: tape measure protein [Candidatus Cryptobacteroides sp.]